MSLKIGTLIGVPVKLHYTLILGILLIAWTLAVGYLPHNYPDNPLTTYWIIGILGAILLFISVLVHELAHSFVAKKNGLPVRRIELFIFGGVSEIEEEPKEPNLEFKIAFVGPVTSFFIALVLWLIHHLSNLLGAPLLILAPLEYGAYINLLLGGFNLIPAFPLDGGRVLRAIIWRWKKNLLKATKNATNVGIGFSYLLIFGGLLFIIRGGFIGGLWLILIGWFLRNGAESSYRQTIITETLSGVSVGDIMTKEVHTVAPEASITEIVENSFGLYKHGGFPVEQESKLIGLITFHDINKIPKEKKDEITVSEVMTPFEKLKYVSPDQSAIDALMMMSKHNIGRLPVQVNNVLVGIITRSDILHSIRLRTEMAGNKLINLDSIIAKK